MTPTNNRTESAITEQLFNARKKCGRIVIPELCNVCSKVSYSVKKREDLRTITKKAMHTLNKKLCDIRADEEFKKIFTTATDEIYKLDMESVRKIVPDEEFNKDQNKKAIEAFIHSKEVIKVTDELIFVWLYQLQEKIYSCWGWVLGQTKDQKEIDGIISQIKENDWTEYQSAIKTLKESRSYLLDNGNQFITIGSVDYNPFESSI